MSASVKLDPESATLLDQLARSSSRTKQEIVRQALRSLCRYPQVASNAFVDNLDAGGRSHVLAGFLHDRIGDTGQLKRKARTHRAIIDALATDGAVLATYHRLIRVLVVDRAPLTKDSWTGMHSDILAIGRALCDSAAGK